jgi:type II secretory pathway pseudopilin PulG
MAPSINQKGFSVLEIIFSAALAAIFVSVFVGALITSRNTAHRSGDQTRAVLVAEEGLEAVRSVRDRDFAGLTDGTYGVALANNRWDLTNTPDTTDIFTRSIEISSVDEGTKKIDATVTWRYGDFQTGSTTLATYLTRWRDISTSQASSSVIDISNTYYNNEDQELRGITLAAQELDVIIAGIQATWQNSKKIERIKMESTIVWSKNGPGSPSGSQRSGTELDVQDYSIAASTNAAMRLKFNGSMEGQDITLIVTFSDGSSQSVVINNLEND